MGRQKKKKQREILRSIAAVQPTAITKKKHRKNRYLLLRSSQHCYNLHIAAVFYTAAIVSTQNDIFIVVRFSSTTISTLMPLKHIYCGGSMSLYCRTPQKTRATVAVQWNAAIDPIYSGGLKKRRNMWHIKLFILNINILIFLLYFYCFNNLRFFFKILSITSYCHI